MNLPRIALAAVLLAVAAFVLLGLSECSRSNLAAKLGVASSEQRGFTRDSGRPTIPDLPRGVKAVATVAGSVRYLPARPAPGATPPPLLPGSGAGGGCDLDALDVSLDCKAEVASASGSGVARLWVHGLLRDGTRTRELPWARVGDPVPLRLEDGREQPVETEAPIVKTALPPPVDRFALGIRRPSRWRTGWVAGVGLAYDPARGNTAAAAFVGYGVSF